jgi:ribonuclease HII
MKHYPDFSAELALGGLVAGVDEAGRAPLAGSVVAAAVILNPHHIPEGINDSKKLSLAKRETLFVAIQQTALAYGIGSATAQEIDALNILQASLLAMRRALQNLTLHPDHALIDGNKLPDALPFPATALVQGDSRSLSIAAASILAKVTRDREMQLLAERYTGYGWERNAGYPTPEHKEALRQLGVTPYHRRSFRPVREVSAVE